MIATKFKCWIVQGSILLKQHDADTSLFTNGKVAFKMKTVLSLAEGFAYASKILWF